MPGGLSGISYKYFKWLKKLNKNFTLITINVYTTYMKNICSDHISDRLTPPRVLASIPTRQDSQVLTAFHYCITYLGSKAIYDNKPVTKLCLMFSNDNVHQYLRGHQVQTINRHALPAQSSDGCCSL